MYQTGELVVYGTTGVCRVEGVTCPEMPGEDRSRRYYLLKPLHQDGIIYTPADSGKVPMRPVISAREAEALIDAMPAMPVEENSNWNKRYRENMVRMKSGDLYEVARVIKCLMTRDSRRGLSTGERKMLHTARQILLSELVLSEEAGYAEVEARVDRAILSSIQAQ